MGDVERAVNWSKRLEGHLRRHHGAEGRGLHELTSSVERSLPADVVRKLRFIATVRNRLVHEADYRRIDDRRGFVDACKACDRALAPRRLPWRRALAAVVLLAIIAGGLWWWLR